MSNTLYRKYRPQSWATMIGQNHIKQTLQNEIAKDEVAHAYLFCGPRGLGKTTAARLLAKSLNCLNRSAGQSEPCNKCASCLDIGEAKAIDLIEIDAASHTGVDNVRENIIANSRFSPSVAKYKVFIIDEVHMLSNSAFNAMLKIMEEPPAHAIFILCTTEIHELPETIISRCQRFDFRRVTRQDLLDLLNKVCFEEKKEVETRVLEEVVRLSDGCVRDAESLLGKIFSLGDKINWDLAEIILPRSDFASIIKLLEFLTKQETEPALRLVNKLMEEGVELPKFVADLIEVLRKVMLIKTNNGLGELAQEFTAEVEELILNLAKGLTMEQVVSWLDLFIELKQELKSAQIMQLPLEMAIIRICDQETKNKPRQDDDLPPASRNSESRKTTKPVKNEAAISSAVLEKTIESEPAEIIAEPVIAEASEQIAEKSNPEPVFTGEGPKSLKDITDKWGDFLTKILEYNFPLASMLKISQPLRLVDNNLEVGLKYKFYLEKLVDRKYQQILNKATESVYGRPLRIVGIIKEDIDPVPVNWEEREAAPQEDGIASQVMDILGGKIVE